MGINFDSLFRKVGRIGQTLYVLNQAQAALVVALDSLDANYADYRHDQYAQVEFSRTALTRALPSGLMSVLASLAANTLIELVGEDVPDSGLTVQTALAELVDQMVDAGQTVLSSAVTATSSARTGNVGNGTLVAATKSGDGLVRELLVAESARVLCTGDSYGGLATAGNETFVYSGAVNTAGTFDYDWPNGSSSAASLTCVSAADDATSGGNLLTNSDFETWSGSPLAADSWTITVGAWATNAVRTATPFAGTYSLRLPAGVSLTSFYQAVPTDLLTVVSSYAVNLYLRTVSGTASAGVLTVELTDGSGTVVNDEQGVPNAFTIDLTALTTAWVARSGVFRIPSIPPAAYRLRLRVSTGVTGADVLVDEVAMCGLAAPYPGGPGLAVFRGSVPWKVRDGFDFGSTNDRGGADYGATFQTLFQRLYQMTSFGLLLPSTGTAPTLPDSFITDVS